MSSLVSQPTGEPGGEVGVPVSTMTAMSVEQDAQDTAEYVVHDQVSGNKEEGRNVLFNDTLNTFLFTVVWRRTYGKGPLR